MRPFANISTIAIVKIDGEIRADAAGAICADWTTPDFGHPTATEAVAVFSTFDWAGEIRRSDEREAAGEDTTYPNLTLRIGSAHLSIDSEGDAGTFHLEICLERPKRLFGILTMHRFFEASAVSAPQVREAIRVFYHLDSEYRTSFFASLVSGGARG